MKNCLTSSKWIRDAINFILLIIFAFSLTSCDSGRIIVNGLDEKEANEILVFLASKNIDATKVQAASEGGGGGKDVKWNINVPSFQSNEAMALLNQVGLPRRRGQNLLGIFSNTGLVPSGMEQKVRYQAGLAEQIANTIRKIDGVLEADVQLSIPEEDPLNPLANKQKITASVFVKHSGVLDDPNSHLTTRIKRLVAGSVNGLEYDNVTVIGDRARFIDTGGHQGTLGEDEKSLVHVWSMLIASESLTRFRLIFFSFIIGIVVLVIALAWLLWKFIYILKNVGFKHLLSYHAIQPEEVHPKEVAQESEKEEDEKKEESDTTETEKNVDET